MRRGVLLKIIGQKIIENLLTEPHTTGGFAQVGQTDFYEQTNK